MTTPTAAPAPDTSARLSNGLQVTAPHGCPRPVDNPETEYGPRHIAVELVATGRGRARRANQRRPRQRLHGHHHPRKLAGLPNVEGAGPRARRNASQIYLCGPPGTRKTSLIEALISR